jgi:hypothetical protein
VQYVWTMNYIKQLEKENQILKEFVSDLETYLSSSKFSENVMVNKSDIFLRMGEMRNKLLDNGINPYKVAK